MQGRKELSPKLLYQVSLHDLVADDSFYRKLDAALDLRFLYTETEAYYGTEGQQSIDPVVFFKICLVGYLNNLTSDRRLMAFCANCLDVRWYIRYDIDEPLPWHSTISRTRQLLGEEVFLSLFRKVLRLCVQRGMVAGRRQAVDSAYIKANASMDSLVEKAVLDDVVLYAGELDAQSEYKVSRTRKMLVERHHRWKEVAYKGQPGGSLKRQAPVDEHGHLIRPKFLSNHTHYSPVDPDARISVKPGKARQLNYYGQLSVDESNHVITAACADHADKRDSQCMAQILGQAVSNLKTEGLNIQEIIADTGYSSGESLRACALHGVEAWIPNFGQYVPERPGFTYIAKGDYYQCTRGNRAKLTFKGLRTDSKGYTKRTYRSSEHECGPCPLRKSCCGAATRFKKIDDSVDKPLYDAMHAKMQAKPEYAQKMRRIRSRTVEPVLGTLLNFLGMRKVYTRGLKQANKHVLMAALAYNLKKYVKYISKQPSQPIDAKHQAAHASNPPAHVTSGQAGRNRPKKAKNHSGSAEKQSYSKWMRIRSFGPMIQFFLNSVVPSGTAYSTRAFRLV